MRDRWARFAGRATRAAGHGLPSGLELVPPFTRTPTLASPLDVLELCGTPSAKLAMDSFHFFRSGEPCDLLEDLPAGSIITVQVNGGPIPATARRRPGYRRGDE